MFWIFWLLPKKKIILSLKAAVGNFDETVDLVCKFKQTQVTGPRLISADLMSCNHSSQSAMNVQADSLQGGSIEQLQCDDVQIMKNYSIDLN